MGSVEVTDITYNDNLYKATTFTDTDGEISVEIEPVADVNARFDALEASLTRLTEMCKEMYQDIATLREHVDTIAPEIKPAIDSLMNSPIIRMMTGGKKS